MTESFIKLENVCLDYILKTGSSSIRKFAIQKTKKILRQPVDYNSFNLSYRALNNINLDIKNGDKIGIFGKNGAGKSSLLRVLAEIYKPTSGSLKKNGHTSCLFDINLGLNPDATGVENIITICILNGMTKTDALMIIDDVADFCELGDFLHKPVRMYSSGMQMKLAFGVATSGTPDILLIDEVIGVGDAKFMQKATTRIKNLMDNSNILVLTSHDNEVVEKFCNKAIVLDKGNILYYGNIASAIEKYSHLLFDPA